MAKRKAVPTPVIEANAPSAEEIAEAKALRAYALQPGNAGTMSAGTRDRVIAKADRLLSRASIGEHQP